MPATGIAYVGPHAVRRFVERIAPGLTYEEARDAILAGLERAGRGRMLAPRRGKPPAMVVRVRAGDGYPYNFRAVLVPPEDLSLSLPAVATILRSGR